MRGKICPFFLLLTIVLAKSQFPPPKCADSCAAVTCLKPTCKGGTVLDKCGCCPLCAKVLGEKCGGNIGTCDTGLSCRDGVCSCGFVCLIACEFGNIPDKHGCPTCVCRTLPCPLRKCKPCPHGFQKDTNGCQTCKCACPKLSNCAYIKCGYGVIKSKDKNGCEVCSCKPKPAGCVHKGKRFRVGSKRYQQCNKCFCHRNGLWACTKRYCRKGVCYCNGRAIRNRQSIFDGCNRCTCHARPYQFGNFACTRKACPKGCSSNLCCTKRCPNGYQVNRRGCRICGCKPSVCRFNGKTFKYGERRHHQCNHCVCRGIGRWTCTKRKCQKGVCYCRGRALPNGKSYFDGCNTCTCIAKKNEIGLIACTKRGCPKGCSANLCCSKKCPNGYQTDKKGCSICKCKCKSTCDTLVCAGPSIEKFTDKNGCLQCRCKPIIGKSIEK